MSFIERLAKLLRNSPVNKVPGLSRLVAELDWRAWDKELERDVAAGKLDFIVQQVSDEKRKGRLREL